MTDWSKVIHAVCPHGEASIIAGFAESMPGIVDRFDISTPLRQAHFIAQCCHESAGLETTTEYASGRAYEGRRDLGNVVKGDGVRFKGRGLIQLTGRANYAKFGAELGVDLVSSPESAAEFPAAAELAALYWKSRNINRLADRDDVIAVTRAVNGGTNGLASRKMFLAKAKRALQAPAAVGLLSAPAPDDDGGGDPDATQVGRATVEEIVDRKTATVDDLRAAGSRTIAGADDASKGGVLAGLGAVATTGATIANSVLDVGQQARDAADKGAGLIGWAQGHWPLALAILGACVAAYAVWRIHDAANRVRAARVDDKRSGANTGR